MKEKIKVGIITMHRVINYGSVLQAYATQFIIEKLGYNCKIIDYEYPNIFQYKRGTIPYEITWRGRIAKYLWLKPRWRRMNRFSKFIRKRLKTTQFFPNREKLNRYNFDFDVYVTGSDQVWNTIHTKGDTTFLLDFVKNKKKVSYASSFASNSIEKKYFEVFKKYLSKYDYISVREEKGRSLVKELINKDVPIVLDPTLLLDEKDWHKLISYSNLNLDKRKYILVYELHYAFNPYPLITEIVDVIRKETGYDVFTIGEFSDYKYEHLEFNELGPEDFVKLFAYASVVVTSSFHGTAFAVNFSKRLYSITDSRNDNRQKSLLNTLGLSNCIIDISECHENIDYTQQETFYAQNELALERKKSINYLSRALC